MLGEEDAIVRLLQGAPKVLFTAQVPRCDGEEVLPRLLIRIILGLQSQESSGTHGSFPRTCTEDREAQDSQPSSPSRPMQVNSPPC